MSSQPVSDPKGSHLETGVPFPSILLETHSFQKDAME